MYLPFLLLLYILNFVNSENAQDGVKPKLSCFDENDKDKDFFVIYKPPLRKKSAQRHYYWEDGLNYFMTKEMRFLDSGSALWKTLSKVRENQDDAGLEYYAFNDQVPKKGWKNEWGVLPSRPSSLAHSKGYIAFLFDDNTKESGSGFFLQHSLPRFPINPKDPTIEGPKNYDLLGQHLFCIKLKNVADFDELKTLLAFENVLLYPRNPLDSFYEQVDYQRWVTREMSGFDTNEERTKKLKVSKIQDVTVYTKSPKLCLEYIEEKIKTEVNEELWVRSFQPHVPSNPEIGITPLIALPNATMSNEGLIKATKDHSKWLIAKRQPLACLCDLNREGPHIVRGGSCFCLENPNLWNAFKSTFSAESDQIKKKHLSKVHKSCGNPNKNIGILTPSGKRLRSGSSATGSRKRRRKG